MLPYIILFVLGEDGEPFLEESDELLGHFVELGNIRIGINIAEPGTDGVVNKEQVRKLMPRSIVHCQSLVVFQAVWPDLHQAAILGATPWASIKPDDCPLSISDVLVLVVPEEKVSVMLRRDFDVSIQGGRVSGLVSPQ